jgi:hypothetical protein
MALRMLPFTTRLFDDLVQNGYSNITLKGTVSQQDGGLFPEKGIIVYEARKAAFVKLPNSINELKQLREMIDRCTDNCYVILKD